MVYLDSNFNIPYKKLDKLFLDYKIRNEAILLMTTAAATDEQVELFPNSKTVEKFLIGFTVVATHTTAQFFRGAVNPEPYNFVVENSGNTIFPKNVISKVMPAGSGALPYDTVCGGFIDGCYTSAAGAVATLLNNSVKVRIDERIRASERLIVHVGNASAVSFAFYLYAVYAEGKLR